MQQVNENGDVDGQSKLVAVGDKGKEGEVKSTERERKRKQCWLREKNRRQRWQMERKGRGRGGNAPDPGGHFHAHSSQNLLLLRSTPSLLTHQPFSLAFHV